MQKERIYWIDQAKALGVLTVMLVHAPIPLFVEHYLRSFNMPRFFIIAGLFLQLNQPFQAYCKNKIARLILPYLFFSFLSYFIWLGYKEITIGDDAAMDPFKPFLWIFYANGGGNMIHNRPLWFLPSLFTTLLFVYLINKISKPYKYFVIGLCAMFGYVLIIYLPFRLPWSLDIVFITSVLVMIGYIFRKKFLSASLLSWKGMLFWSIVSVTAAFSNVFVKLSSAEIGNLFLFYMSALAGAIVTLDLTKRIPYSPVLSYIGKHTLPIYSLHMVVYLFVYEFFLRFPIITKAFVFNDFVIDANSIFFKILQLPVFILLGLIVPIALLKVYELITKSFKGNREANLEQKNISSSDIKNVEFIKSLSG